MKALKFVIKLTPCDEVFNDFTIFSPFITDKSRFKTM